MYIYFIIFVFVVEKHGKLQILYHAFPNAYAVNCVLEIKIGKNLSSDLLRSSHLWCLPSTLIESNVIKVYNPSPPFSEIPRSAPD